MVRVGMITGEYPPLRGGIADYTQRLVGALGDLDVVPSVLTSQRAATERQESWVLPHVRRWDRSIWRLVAQSAQRRRWDLVHIQYQPAAYELRADITLLPWVLHRALPHLKVVTTFHDLRVPYLFPKAGPLRQLLVRLLANRSDAVIAVAAEDVPLLWRWHTRGARPVFRSRPAAPASLAHIAVGNNLDAPPPAGFDRDLWRSRIGAAPDTLVVGYVGFINRSKGVDVLVRALARLLSQGLDVRVLMVGEQVGSSDTENVRYLAEVTALIERLRLQPYVHWTGFQQPERLGGVGALCGRGRVTLSRRRLPAARVTAVLPGARLTHDHRGPAAAGSRRSGPGSGRRPLAARPRGGHLVRAAGRCAGSGRGHCGVAARP